MKTIFEKAFAVCVHSSRVLLLLLAVAADASEPAATAVDARRGQIEVSYTISALLDQVTTEAVAEFMDVDSEVTWQMYVPESYDPTRPAGLMVYISPTDKGWLPRRWQPVIDDSNLIWIAAHESGNEEIVARRMLYAVLGPQIVRSMYFIDPDRVYLSGFSGGGKVSGMVAINFANVFRGAIYICGAEHWIEDPPEHFSHVERNRYVFLTGSNDFNRDLTSRIFRKYEAAGLSNIEFIKVPRMGHSNPPTRYFQKAVDFLDQRD